LDSELASGNSMARSKVFTIYETFYDRSDGVNDHGTIKIRFADGKFAQIDNG
jgi:hypothetical protein